VERQGTNGAPGTAAPDLGSHPIAGLACSSGAVLGNSRWPTIRGA
jgi:hypothetical protein